MEYSAVTEVVLPVKPIGPSFAPFQYKSHLTIPVSSVALAKNALFPADTDVGETCPTLGGNRSANGVGAMVAVVLANCWLNCV